MQPRSGASSGSARHGLPLAGGPEASQISV